MAIQKFGYGAESLQKDKLENLGKELESRNKLINIKPVDISDKLEKHINEIHDLNDVEGASRLEKNYFYCW